MTTDAERFIAQRLKDISSAHTYLQEIENLFWDWYLDQIVEMYRPGDKERFNDEAKRRAGILGIKLGDIDHDMYWPKEKSRDG